MLTTEQLPTLKAGILAETDPTFVALRADNATGAMADWLNGAAVPAVKGWCTSVDPVNTDSSTPWDLFDGLTAGKRDSFVLAFLRYPRDYARNATRKWVTDVWGAATAGSSAAAILSGAGLRNITRAETILGGTNTVSTGTVSALKLTWEGYVTNEEVVAAINLP